GPQVEQRAARVRVLHAQRRVEVPGVRDATLAAARLVGREPALEHRVVEPLHLPRDDAVLHVDVPRAAAGAVDAVRRAHDAVVLPAVAVDLLPRAELRVAPVLDPARAAAAVLAHARPPSAPAAPVAAVTRAARTLLNRRRHAKSKANSSTTAA